MSISLSLSRSLFRSSPLGRSFELAANRRPGLYRPDVPEHCQLLLSEHPLLRWLRQWQVMNYRR